MARKTPPAVPPPDTDYDFEPEPLHDLVRMHFRGIMPPWLYIFDCVARFQVRETYGGALSDEELATEIYYLDGDYRRGQLTEQRILANAERPDLPLQRLNGPRNRQNPKRGNYPKKPAKIGDTVLIWRASELLEKMKGRGSNQPFKWWSVWDDSKGKRSKSTLQKFVETILVIIDPVRLTPTVPRGFQAPKSSFYSQVKKRRGLVRPKRAIK